ncbi:MAG: hypothetical protein AB7G25_07660 [Sphingomonadaceae bacterium]
MPVKRRLAKRRIDPQGEAAAWETIFDTGRDFFGSAREFGIAVDEYGRPDRDAAESAWKRLHHLHVPESAPCWAEREFGEPK